MNIPFVDLKAQYLSMKSEIDSSIKDVLEHTAFIGGEQVKSFAKNFADLYEVAHCVPVANGTDALYIALKQLNVGPGDEVITTASSWISTAEVVVQVGARPVFVDIDEYFTIDADKIEERITSRTKAIIPVHLYGQMCDMEKIMSIAEQYNLKVIEDCAQSHFSSFKGKRAGTWGHCGTFSFYPGKNLGAYGDAGCIITADADLAEQMRIFANHGAPTKHNHIMPGINSRLDGLQAAVLNVKLNYIESWTKARADLGKAYDRALADIEKVIRPKRREHVDHSFHVYGILIDNREDIKSKLKNLGVASQVHYPVAMPLMPAFNSGSTSIEKEYPNAVRHMNCELSLPIYPEMTVCQLEYVVDSLGRVMNK